MLLLSIQIFSRSFVWSLRTWIPSSPVIMFYSYGLILIRWHDWFLCDLRTFSLWYLTVGTALPAPISTIASFFALLSCSHLWNLISCWSVRSLIQSQSPNIRMFGRAGLWQEEQQGTCLDSNLAVFSSKVSSLRSSMVPHFAHWKWNMLPWHSSILSSWKPAFKKWLSTLLVNTKVSFYRSLSLVNPECGSVVL